MGFLHYVKLLGNFLYNPIYWVFAVSALFNRPRPWGRNKIESFGRGDFLRSRAGRKAVRRKEKPAAPFGASNKRKRLPRLSVHPTKARSSAAWRLNGSTTGPVTARQDIAVLRRLKVMGLSGGGPVRPRLDIASSQFSGA